MNSVIDTNSQINKIAKLILKHSPFLEGFVFNKFAEQNGMNLWCFSHKFPDYIFKVIFAEKNDTWRVKVFVYWKKTTNEPSLGAGKDFELQIGPFNSFSEASSELHKRFNNNPIMGKHLYHDDYQLNMDKETVKILIMLKEKGEEVMAINDSHFDELKKIYKSIKNIPDDKLLNYCKIKNRQEADKQDFLLDLQIIHKLGFYKDMKKMGHSY